MINPGALLADLRVKVKDLEADLRTRAELPGFDPTLRREWHRAKDAERTAASYETWLDGEVTQAAMAWVLGTVFLRFCEDNKLIDLPYLAGPGERLVIATERQQAFFEQNPHQTDRDWILAGFEDMATASPVAADLFDRAHNPLWRITPSHDAAKKLLTFWRTQGEDAAVAHNFTDSGWNTRFLGDLYQNLSEYAKKTYALLQTPEFVEEFILDLTLKPAIEEFGLEPDPPRARPDLPHGLRVIDPACGSGHFLLGAFARLMKQWEDQAPGADRWDLIRRVLTGLHGVDKNPFAVSIARFRLLLAGMKAGKVDRLVDAHEFPLNIAVGDSLLHGRGAPGNQGELFEQSKVHTYWAEDVGGFIKSVDILGANSYHVVVGNPPYITVKDKRENKIYREAYRAVCAGQYSLSVPFAARFFHLAKVAGGDRRGAGFVGQITSNSFMKREFGRPLIENFFRQQVNLTHVIDTSGAYIPGHGTPTAILVGRNTIPSGGTIRAALGVRGEPSQPDIPETGKVWRAIVDQIGKPGSESEWITVSEMERDRFSVHPWSLSGGGARELMEFIAVHSQCVLNEHILLIGRTTHTGSDEAYFAPAGAWVRQGLPLDRVTTLIEGDIVRDWKLTPQTEALFPYNRDLQADLNQPSLQKFLWLHRTHLRTRREPGGTHEEIGLTWYEWSRWHPERFKIPLGIPFAFVATHNHFALDRGGKVFNRSAPVIKLREEASEDDHLALLGALNSSTACFWLKQVSYPKGGDPVGDKGARVSAEAWSDRYEFTGSNLEEFPLPRQLPLEFGWTLDGLAQRLARVEPSAVCANTVPTREQLDEARAEYGRLRGRMIALQEELDWEVYRLYGLLTEHEAAELRVDPDSVPELRLGERAFEIALARRMAAREVETEWFARHGSTPITEIPTHWPEAYRRMVERRIEVIEKRRDIALIERPECKRRWTAEPWEKKEKAALRNWLLDRCEDRHLWFSLDGMGTEQPRLMTMSRLADRLRADADFVSVARLYAGRDVDLAEVNAEITDAEHVPYLAALRYKDVGMRKRSEWEGTWALQRQEDVSGERLDIAAPPKYTSADFRKASYWSNRGKLDVPKERFISYPGASPDGDGSLLLGWAGWDHREQAHALMTIIEERTTRDGWGKKKVVPLIAGLAEIMPWVRQWHGEVDPVYGMSPAGSYAAYLENVQRRYGLSKADLTLWRPHPPGRGRKAKGTPEPDDVLISADALPTETSTPASDGDALISDSTMP